MNFHFVSINCTHTGNRPREKNELRSNQQRNQSQNRPINIFFYCHQKTVTIEHQLWIVAPNDPITDPNKLKCIHSTWKWMKWKTARLKNRWNWENKKQKINVTEMVTKEQNLWHFSRQKKNTAQSPRLCGGILIFVGDMIRDKALVGAYVKWFFITFIFFNPFFYRGFYVLSLFSN